MTSLSPAESHAAYSLASALRVDDPQWLIDLINFESGWNPTASNPVSSAKGLIQFMDSTARGMGYASSQDLISKHPDIPSQLEGPVYEYLKPYSPFGTETSLYLSVFFPAARKYPPNTPFKEIYQDLYGSGWESRYNNFINSNPGILTPQHYINYVKKKPIVRVAIKTGIGLLTALLLYALYRNFK